ncbi:992_t:CDS:2 [Entrophospora sp. SA101]|nr:987_t:CDS:2 [Entrophospora sp. SA101]CAJ0637449.1 992_t:CDS:2 [Entrophospora sp. SA101]
MSDNVEPVAHSDEDLEKLSIKTKLQFKNLLLILLRMNVQVRATNILRTHKDKLHYLSKALMDYETLARKKLIQLLKD